MKLTINNADKLKRSFCRKSYIIDMVRQLPESYEWVMQEINGEDSFSVLLDRCGEWDPEDQKWYYRLTYGQQKHHLVSADWFGDFDNAMETFNDIIDYTKLNKK